MSSTEFNIGLASNKSSSRVLKPPGGGHSDIFGAPDQPSIHARPKYDQQNSSNLHFCTNTTDPNILVEQTRKQLEAAAGTTNGTAAGGGGGVAAAGAPSTNGNGGRPVDNIIGGGGNQAPQAQPKGRVPPGGFSSGLW